MIKQKLARFLAAVIVLISAPLLAQADTALTFTGGSDHYWPGATLGWEFSISEPITVTELGYYDLGGDGLVADHQVGIFPAGENTILVSTTVTNASTIDNGFRYAPIYPFVLQAGNYVIAAWSPEDGPWDHGISFADQQTAPGITYVQEWFLYSDQFELPTDQWSADGGNFGPNFKFVTGLVEAQPVPFLSSGMIAGLILLLLGIGASRLRRLN